ncbi:hypothetical protein M011DRAFT_401141 [Sporormia fimetaria CBS 119925]|uniref:DNA/RNA-binding protein Kin17 WH-like domain-containing protein n=1 Tax=Sporormia fimetaria CBS 119925 TaxID=1340428 RepID=A0A6A6VC85_9PLEO|nr:hypothetical protein M011DRAFT_401141 [Sporormia fimetaria CBS 119925]
MPRAEVGSNKYLANKMKSKGLQRLRWYCQGCEKQCRDANGFKCHVNSESHVRQMQLIGEDPRKHLNTFSNDFQRDFITLLRVAHGEKFIGANRFYNEYIRDKEHIHMNATKWASLTEFVKHLGREGTVTVKEDEKDGLMIAWKDTSLQALRRKEDIRAQEAAEARSGAGEDKMLKRMEKRAREEAEARAKAAEARKAAEAARAAEQKAESPTAEGQSSESLEAVANGKESSGDEEKPKEDAAPVKISFGLKPKTVPTTKPGLGMMKSQSIFKRPRADGEEKPVKKVKL